MSSDQTIDTPIDELYDPINAVQRRAAELERELRYLAERDDIELDALGAETTAGEALAGVLEAIADMRAALDRAEACRSTAKRHAAQLYIEH